MELYSEFMARIARGDRHDAGDAEGEHVATDVQIHVRDSATQDVAQDIIRFLESLMNTLA